MEIMAPPPTRMDDLPLAAGAYKLPFFISSKGVCVLPRSGEEGGVHGDRRAGGETTRQGSRRSKARDSTRIAIATGFEATTECSEPHSTLVSRRRRNKEEKCEGKLKFATSATYATLAGGLVLEYWLFSLFSMTRLGEHEKSRVLSRCRLLFNMTN